MGIFCGMCKQSLLKGAHYLGFWPSPAEYRGGKESAGQSDPITVRSGHLGGGELACLINLLVGATIR